MDLGYGEYINISACLKMPYNTSKVFELLNELESKNTQFQEVTMLSISPSLVNYDLVWEGTEEITQNFSYKLLEQYVFSSLDMVIDHCIPARMNINFLDTDSYEVSISLNFQEIEETQPLMRQEKFKHIEQLALNIFKVISPVYALLAIEKSVIGLNGIINDFFSFPTDKVFYNYEIISNYKIFFNTINDLNYIEEIEESGIYFRNSKIDEYDYKENENLFKEIRALIDLN